MSELDSYEDDMFENLPELLRKYGSAAKEQDVCQADASTSGNNVNQAVCCDVQCEQCDEAEDQEKDEIMLEMESAGKKTEDSIRKAIEKAESFDNYVWYVLPTEKIVDNWPIVDKTLVSKDSALGSKNSIIPKKKQKKCARKDSALGSKNSIIPKKKQKKCALKDSIFKSKNSTPKRKLRKCAQKDSIFEIKSLSTRKRKKKKCACEDSDFESKNSSTPKRKQRKCAREDSIFKSKKSSTPKRQQKKCGHQNSIFKKETSSRPARKLRKCVAAVLSLSYKKKLRGSTLKYIFRSQVYKKKKSFKSEKSAARRRNFMNDLSRNKKFRSSCTTSMTKIVGQPGTSKQKKSK